jgi:RHS repeat-associated protein
MAVTNFIWDEVSDNVLLETDDNDAVTTAYVNRPEQFGELLSQDRSGAKSFFHYDGESSTSALTDENEDITDTFIYTAYGEEVARAGTTTNPFGYKGAVGYYTNAETSDIYVRARTYAPAIGCWLSKDPAGFIDGPNLYRAYFVPNGIDPLGLAWSVSFKSIDFMTRCHPDHMFVFFFTIPEKLVPAGSTQIWALNQVDITKLSQDCEWITAESIFVIDVWGQDRIIVGDGHWTVSDTSSALWIGPGANEPCILLIRTIKVLAFNPLLPGGGAIEYPSGSYGPEAFAPGIINSIRQPKGVFIEEYFQVEMANCEKCFSCSWVPPCIECVNFVSINRGTCANNPQFIGETFPLPVGG